MFFHELDGAGSVLHVGGDLLELFVALVSLLHRSYLLHMQLLHGRHTENTYIHTVVRYT
jgi:hypothetical protein